MLTCKNILGAGAFALVIGVAAAGSGCASMDEQTTNSQQPVQDTWITTKVTTALMTIKGADNRDISVETSNGVVTLSGRVESQDKLDALVTAARNVQGVKAVHTDLVQIIH